ncbi:hypothetical protein X975_20495, partial [Stegodyphus mimosarum]
MMQEELIALKDNIQAQLLFKTHECLKLWKSHLIETPQNKSCYRTNIIDFPL